MRFSFALPPRVREKCVISSQNSHMTISERLRNAVREVPNFPIEGISFKDITPIFLDPTLLRDAATSLTEPWRGHNIKKVLGIDSRGFLFGTQMAEGLDAGFVLVRKKGKLPPPTVSLSYALEYGEATIEMTSHSIQPGDKVIIHDDLLATGGTATAAAQLAQQLGAEVIGFSFMIELSFLGGREKLQTIAPTIESLLIY